MGVVSRFGCFLVVSLVITKRLKISTVDKRALEFNN